MLHKDRVVHSSANKYRQHQLQAVTMTMTAKTPQQIVQRRRRRSSCSQLRRPTLKPNGNECTFLFTVFGRKPPAPSSVYLPILCDIRSKLHHSIIIYGQQSRCTRSAIFRCFANFSSCTTFHVPCVFASPFEVQATNNKRSVSIFMVRAMPKSWLFLSAPPQSFLVRRYTICFVHSVIYRGWALRTLLQTNKQMNQHTPRTRKKGFDFPLFSFFLLRLKRPARVSHDLDAFCSGSFLVCAGACRQPKRVHSLSSHCFASKLVLARTQRRSSK